MNFSTIIGLVIILINYRKEQFDLNNLYDQKEITPQDYSIFVSNIENNVTTL